MSYSDMRAKARERLSGKWGKVAVFSLVYILVVGAIEVILAKINSSLASIVVSLLGVPLSFSYMYTLYRVYRDSEDIDYGKFFNDVMNYFAISWKIALRTILKVLVPFIVYFVLTIISTAMIVASAFVGISSAYGYRSSVGLDISSLSSGALVAVVLQLIALVWLITKSLYYSLSSFVYFDNQSLTALECVNKSEVLMQGNRARFFILTLTFIGWAFLCCFTLGIGMLFLTPYIMFAQFAFYDHIKGGNEVSEVPATETVPEEQVSTPVIEEKPEVPTEDVPEEKPEDNSIQDE